MIPGMPPPEKSVIRTPIDLKLKPQWQFKSSRRIFVSNSGEEFAPQSDLPKNSKIAYKVPSLAGTDEAKLSKNEGDLRQYMQVILPRGVSPAEYVNVISGWPSVAEAYVAPQVSLPKHARLVKKLERH